MPTKGYDAFFPDPGAYNTMACRVCGARCRVSRFRTGPTSSVEAIMGVQRAHDRFVCPHADEPWHTAALELLRAAEAEPDAVIAAALRLRWRWLLRNPPISS